LKHIVVCQDKGCSYLHKHSKKIVSKYLQPLFFCDKLDISSSRFGCIELRYDLIFGITEKKGVTYFESFDEIQRLEKLG
jgi:hypothetical protein